MLPVRWPRLVADGWPCRLRCANPVAGPMLGRRPGRPTPSPARSWCPSAINETSMGPWRRPARCCCCGCDGCGSGAPVAAKGAAGTPRAAPAMAGSPARSTSRGRSSLAALRRCFRTGMRPSSSTAGGRAATAARGRRSLWHRLATARYGSSSAASSTGLAKDSPSRQTRGERAAPSMNWRDQCPLQLERQ